MKQLTVSNQVRRTTVDTSITTITAYVNQALITRQGLVTLTGQERELVIGGLPPALQPESVQISGIGTVTVQISGVRLEPGSANPREPDPDDRNVQRQHLEAELRTVQNRLRSLQLQQTFIQNLSEKSVEQFSQGLAHQLINLESTRQLLQFLGDQYDEYARLITQAEQDQQALLQQLQGLQQSPPGSCPSTPGHYTLYVSVEPAGPGDFVLDLSYVVDQASWTPLYEFTFNKLGEQVHFNYSAEVKQQTGEDWSGASLTLSTSELGRGLPLPTLQPWYLEVESTPETRSVTAPSDHPPILAPGTATKVAREAGIATLQLEHENAIASNGQPHRVPIFNGDYPCRIEYVVAPRLATLVYLQATITNQGQGITLLAGKANLFRDHLFIGTTQLEKVAPGQAFQLNLGIDEGVRIERRRVDYQSRRRWLSRDRQSTYAYRITVRNLRSQAIALRLIEQLPISRQAQVRVRLQRTTPRIWLQNGGLLEWTTTLPARAEREFYYQFSVEHPGDLNPTGLT